MFTILFWLSQIHRFRFIFLFYVMFNNQGHIATDSLRVEEPVHTCWSICCTVNHRASASNYQLSNMKCLARNSNRRPQRLKASTLTTTSPSLPSHYVDLQDVISIWSVSKFSLKVNSVASVTKYIYIYIYPDYMALCTNVACIILTLYIFALSSNLKI